MMEWTPILLENNKSAGLVFTLFIILMAVMNITIQNQSGNVI